MSSGPPDCSCGTTSDRGRPTGPVNPKRLLAGLVLLAALVSQSGCHLLPTDEGTPRADVYSTRSERDAWKSRLAGESVQPVKATFHAFGHLLAVSGRFPLPETSPARVRAWLDSHAAMLGIPPQAELAVHDGDQGGHTAGEEGLPRTLVFVVHVKGIPFAGLPIRVVVDPVERAIRVVANGFGPATRGFGDVVLSPEDRAWAAAESHVHGNLQRVTASQTWFDPSWALQRAPGVKQLHWRLEGIDPHGVVRQFFVRSSDRHVSYATPDKTFFGVHQTHKDDANRVLWDSQTLPQGCTAGSSGCTGDALAQSEISRVVMPSVVDLWYRLSSPVPTSAFQWPFTGLHKGPFDNRNRPIQAIVAHNGSVCSLPCLNNGTYYFPSGWLVVDQYGLFGHEYGHRLMQEMKLVHPGTGSGQFSPPAFFTEAMADLIGIVSNYQLRREKYRIGSRFAIGEPIWTHTPGNFGDWNYTPPPVDWEQKTGSCPAGARERIGRAFYNAWKKVEGDLWGSPRTNDPDYQKLFRAWWIVIMSTFADAPEFPAIDDFYAALEGNQRSYFLLEARIYLALLAELEALGLSSGCR